MNSPLLAAALMGAALLATSAQAQDAPPPPPGGPMLADPNNDGVITRDEMLGEAGRRFAAADANHDGKLTQKESQAAMPAPPGGGGRRMRGGMGMRADTNGDGVVALDEARAEAAQRFDRMDTNHDGKIDRTERDAMRQRMMQRLGRGAPPAGPAPQDP